MGILNSSVIKTIQGIGVDNLPSCLKTGVGDYHESLAILKAHLEKMNAKYDPLIESLTCDADLISDKIIDVTEIDMDIGEFIQSGASYEAEIGEDVANMIVSGFDESLQGGLNMAITNSEGILLPIYDHFTTALGLNFVPILAVNEYVSDARQCILYKVTQNGVTRYFVNNILLFKNTFVTVDPQNMDYMTILRYICNATGVRSESNILGTLYSLLGQLVGNVEHNTISECSSELCTFLSLSTDGTVRDKLSRIFDHYYSSLRDLTLPDRLISLYGYVQELIESSELNSCIISLIDVCFSKGSLLEKVAEIRSMANSKYQSIRDVISQSCSILKTNGISGLCEYILTFVREQSTIYQNDDGTLKFTDVGNLVPKIFLCGMISAIGNILTTAVSIVGAMINPVLGAAVAIGASIVNSVVSNFKEAVNQTYAGFVRSSNDDTPIFSLSPSALFQCEVPYSTFADFDVSANSRCFFIPILGGKILVGPGAFGPDGQTISKWRCEFHPDFVDRRKMVNDILDSMVTYKELVCHTQSYTNSARTGNYYSAIILHNYTPEYGRTKREYMAQMARYEWNEASPDIVPDLDGDAAGFYKQSDSDLREIMSANLAISIIWLCCMTKTSGNICISMMPIGDAAPISSVWKWLLHSISNDKYLFDIYLDQDSGVAGHTNLATWTELIDIQKDYTVYLTEQSSYSVVSLNVLRPAFDVLVEADETSFINELIPLNCDFHYGIQLPKYEASTLVLSMILLGVGTLLVIAGAAALTTVARRAINNFRAKNAASVEHAWQQLVTNPTKANAIAYNKAVSKANFFSTLLGGTKFNHESYWSGGSTASSRKILTGFVTTQSSRLIQQDSVDVSDLAVILSTCQTISQQVGDVTTALSSVSSDVGGIKYTVEHDVLTKENTIITLISGASTPD